MSRDPAFRLARSRRAGVVGRCVVVGMLVSLTASCVDDSFDLPLSGEDGMRADVRLVGHWELVEATDRPEVLRCKPTMDAKDAPFDVRTTVIEGIPCLTAIGIGPAGSSYIFRYDFVGADGLLLVPPDHASLDAAVAGRTLPARDAPRGPGESGRRIIAASTDQLRGFLRQRADECFPDPLRSEVLLVLRRMKP